MTKEILGLCWVWAIYLIVGAIVTYDLRGAKREMNKRKKSDPPQEDRKDR